MITKINNHPEIFLIHIALPNNPLKNLNCYVIREGKDSLIIDTGFNRPECKFALTEGLAELRINLSYAKVFLTHMHSDHTGLAEWFTDKDIPVYLNNIDYVYLRKSLEGILWSAMKERYMSEGFPPEILACQNTENQAHIYAPKKIFPVQIVKNNDVIHLGSWSFQCIHTPGHTPGHTCLYLKEKNILFSGDHILFDITPNISIWEGVSNSLADYMLNLERLKELPIDATYPAHRQNSYAFCERIDSLIKHHYIRLTELYQILKKTPNLNAYQIASRLTWSARGMPWEKFSPHQHWFAMGETLSHLDWLKTEDYVKEISPKQYYCIKNFDICN